MAFSYAETQESLTLKIEQTNNEILKLDQEIKELGNKINTTVKDATTLKNRIKELTLSRNALAKQVEQTQKKIKLAGNVISNLELDITDKNQRKKFAQSVIKKSIYDMYKYDNVSPLELLIVENNFFDFSEEYNNTLALRKSLRGLVDDIEITKRKLEEDKKQKEQEKVKLESLKQKLALDKKAVEVSQAEKDKLLKETKNKEENYKKLLAENKKKRDLFEKDIQDYESKLKFILDQNSLPNSDHKALSWPLDKIFVTQLFGKTVSSQRLYASGSHSGVDFRASTGTPVKAMADGVVRGVGDTDTYCKGASFGKWVFIEYENGLSSTFGHLSYISAKIGQKVLRGDVVGLTGNTGHSTGPHLHVTVYASKGASVQTLASKSCTGKTFIMPVAATNAYLDPMLYLPVYK